MRITNGEGRQVQLQPMRRLDLLTKQKGKNPVWKCFEIEADYREVVLYSPVNVQMVPPLTSDQSGEHHKH